MNIVFKKGVSLFVIAVVMVVWNPHDSLATSTENPESVQSILILEDNLLDIVRLNPNAYDIQATQYLMGGSASIELLSDTSVRVSGNSQAYIPVDSIRISLYLQQWNGGQWSDVLSIGSTTNYNTSLVSKSSAIKIKKGYYYRTKAVHRIVHNGIIEQLTGVSNSIYAN